LTKIPTWQQVLREDQPARKRIMHVMSRVSTLSLDDLRKVEVEIDRRMVEAERRGDPDLRTGETPATLNRFVFAVPEIVPAQLYRIGDTPVYAPAGGIRAMAVDPHVTEKGCRALLPFSIGKGGRLELTDDVHSPGGEVQSWHHDFVAEFDYLRKTYGRRKKPGWVSPGEGVPLKPAAR
jgi:hypothetical protein